MDRVTHPIGQRFGKLVVLSTFMRGDRYYTCACDCGATTDVRRTHLLRGMTQSCGCLRIKHGLLRNGVRPDGEASWRGIKSRCENPNDKSFRHYGGRGISVCERWSRSLADFLADMGPRPSRAHSIDRIDVNGNYEPGNCRWATPTQQARNQRRTVLNEESAELIRHLSREGLSHREISIALNINKSTVSGVAAGHFWRLAGSQVACPQQDSAGVAVEAT
jgi:hypothetical protein